MENKRIGNLEIRPATYLLSKDKWPEKGAYHIDYWYPNGYYGRESEFLKDGDWYVYPDHSNCRVHKDCFKNPQSCFAIASFSYNEHEGCYEFEFVGSRPLQITKEERDIFWKLIEYGFKELNENE